jgi:hypothetical protein
VYDVDRRAESELSTVVIDQSIDAVGAGRARMVLWRDEGYNAEQVAALLRARKGHARVKGRGYGGEPDKSDGCFPPEHTTG